MPSGSIRFDAIEVSCVEEDVPIAHVDCLFKSLRSRQLEFEHLSPASEVVLVLVCFSQPRHVLSMLGVLPPLLLAVVRRPAAVWTFKVDWSSDSIADHADRAGCQCADTFSTGPHGRDGRFGQRVEEIILAEDRLALGKSWFLLLAKGEAEQPSTLARPWQARRSPRCGCTQPEGSMPVAGEEAAGERSAPCSPRHACCATAEKGYFGRSKRRMSLVSDEIVATEPKCEKSEAINSHDDHPIIEAIARQRHGVHLCAPRRHLCRHLGRILNSPSCPNRLTGSGASPVGIKERARPAGPRARRRQRVVIQEQDPPSVLSSLVTAKLVRGNQVEMECACAEHPSPVRTKG